MIKFENVEPGSSRAMAVVGDKLGTTIGKPTGDQLTPVFNCTDQPAGSDVFAGLGPNSDGIDVPYSSIGSVTFTASGFHTFTATAANGEIVRVDVVCFGANALTVPEIKYQDNGRSQLRSAQEARGILRALGLQAPKAGVEAALEGGAPAAPYWGTKPTTLGLSNSASFRPFGGW
jgi:hypothetical protein